MTRRLAPVLIALGLVLASCGGPRPPEGALVYSGPVEQSIAAGAFVPGADIEYVGRSEDRTAEVRIAGQRALKRSGDSLDWEGSPLEGVDMRLDQRILWFNQEQLQLAGVIRLTVEDVNPEPGPVPLPGEEPNPNQIVYKAPVIYRIGVGETIPGATLTYRRNTDNGAEIGGLPAGDYPYRQVGDSIAWQGRLRPGVQLDLVLRTTLYDDRNLNVTGVATLILTRGE